MKKRYGHNLSHTETSTVNMGACYPSNVIEVFPGDSFKITAKDLTRFLPQVAPTMHDVFIGVDTYQVPLRQLFEKLHLDWDAYLTGGEDGTTVVDIPQIIVPISGYDPGSLADFLGYPTNWTDPETGEQHTGVCAGQSFSALPVLAYMHIINENYRDQNFIAKFDFTKYQEFLDGEYQFEDAQGNPIDYELTIDSIFPKAWSRDYYGRALPNTQRGVSAVLPLGETAELTPQTAPVINNGTGFATPDADFTVDLRVSITTDASPINPTLVESVWTYSFVNGTNYPQSQWFDMVRKSGSSSMISYVRCRIVDGRLAYDIRLSNDVARVVDSVPSYSPSVQYFTQTIAPGMVVNLEGVQTNLSSATAASIIAFRTAARMQQCGEWLQDAGARAVEFTLKFFGVRIPDGRVQRPIFHGSFRMPVVFTEVLQTSQSDMSPLATLGGHGITGGVNRPIHIKVIEHGFIMSIMHVMPRSQFQNTVPKYLLRRTRWDMPNPLFQGIGEQPIKRIEIYPETENPDETFGYIPQFSELMSIPSTLHGHMKDTFLHWTMARVYTSEPYLSAAWRYERPSSRSFAVQGEDQMQVCIGYEIHSRRVFKRNQTPGIHVI